MRRGDGEVGFGDGEVRRGVWRREREIGERSRSEKKRFYKGIFLIFCQRGTT